MTVTVTIKVLFMVVGLALWQLPTPPKVSEAGKWTYIIALLTWLWPA